MHGQERKDLFRKMNIYIYFQYPYLLSKGLRNLFPGLLERPKCQIVFFFLSDTKNSGSTHGSTSTTSNILFNQGVLDFVLKLC